MFSGFKIKDGGEHTLFVLINSVSAKRRRSNTELTIRVVLLINVFSMSFGSRYQSSPRGILEAAFSEFLLDCPESVFRLSPSYL